MFWNWCFFREVKIREYEVKVNETWYMHIITCGFYKFNDWFRKVMYKLKDVQVDSYVNFTNLMVNLKMWYIKNI
jgi:hypothetical protein